MNQRQRETKPGPFQEEAVKSDATLANLIHSLFEAPNADDDDILAKIIHAIDDDLSLIIDALDHEQPYLGAVQRVCIRMRNLIQIGIGLRTRCAEPHSEREGDVEP